MDTAFLEDKPLDEVAKTPEDEARAAEELYASQLAKELRVSFFLGSSETLSLYLNLPSSKNEARVFSPSTRHIEELLPPGAKFWSN